MRASELQLSQPIARHKYINYIGHSQSPRWIRATASEVKFFGNHLQIDNRNRNMYAHDCLLDNRNAQASLRGYSERCPRCDECPTAFVIRDAQQWRHRLSWPFLDVVILHDLSGLHLRRPSSMTFKITLLDHHITTVTTPLDDRYGHRCGNLNKALILFITHHLTASQPASQSFPSCALSTVFVSTFNSVTVIRQRAGLFEPRFGGPEVGNRPIR